MPRYFFHIRSGDDLIRDLEGVELESPVQAQEEAEAAAREILSMKVLKGEVVNGDRFEVLDNEGAMVLSVEFRDLLLLK
jgi:hypothetical protein